MPGRLGDDPLSRKRSPSANEMDTTSIRPGFHAQQTSHNDVFFRRRTESPRQMPESAPGKESGLEEEARPEEKPEISEVADIMRTVKVAESTQGAERLAGPEPIDEPNTPTKEPAEKAERTPPTVSGPVASLEPPTPITGEGAGPDLSQPEPQPQKGEGLFKRLFGRFGK